MAIHYFEVVYTATYIHMHTVCTTTGMQLAM